MSKNLKKKIDRFTEEKIELCNVVSDLRNQLNEIEDSKSDALHEARLASDKLRIVTEDRDVLRSKITNLEGMYKSEYGNISSAKELTEQLRRKELDIELAA